MIVKNSFGLSILLGEKAVRKIKNPLRFSGSSLHRARKKGHILEDQFKEFEEANAALNYASLLAEYNHIQYFMWDASMDNCEDLADDCEKKDYEYSVEQEIVSSDNFYQSLAETERPPETEDTETLEYLDEQNILSKLFPLKSVSEDEESPKPKTERNKQRTMSQRTKQKIRKKVIAFSQVYDKLTFATLTFVNQTDDKTAVKILSQFLDNCTKRLKGFEYIWVAERQNKNTVFAGNIHFHLITNKYLKVEKYWAYWFKLQEKHGIIPRNKDFKPSSTFDIKRLNANNIKAIGMYITKYVTKNADLFDCQVWNCSKGISILYTDFYTEFSFVEKIEKVLDADLEPIYTEYCTLYRVPLNRKTLPMYEKLNQKNRVLINSK